MKNGKRWIALILDGLIFLLTALAMCNYAFGWVDVEAAGPALFNFFTNDSNLLNGLVALLAFAFLLKNRKQEQAALPSWLKVLRLLSTTAVTLTLLTVLCVLAPSGGTNFFSWDYWGWLVGWPYMLFVHFICPLLSIVSFVFFEDEERLHWRKSFFGIIPALLYGVVWLIVLLLNPNFATKQIPYFFLDIYHQAWYISVAWFVGLSLGSWLISFLLLLAHNSMVKVVKPAAEAKPAPEVKPAVVSDKTEEVKTAKTEPSTTEPSKTESAATATPETPKADVIETFEVSETSSDDIAVVQDSEDTDLAEEEQEIREEEEAKKANPNGYMNRPRIYHIAKQGDTGKWQVRLATGQKAIKLFDTQALAIEYAKGLVKTQGGSIRVHSLKGKMRKE